MLDKTIVQGADLAFGIQFTLQMPDSRQLTFTTAYPQDCTPQELDALLLKMSNAADKLDKHYRRRALKLLIERSEVELVNLRQQRDNVEQKYRDEWGSQGKKGRWQATGTQRAAIQNFNTTEGRIVDTIKKLREEVEDLDKELKAE